MTAPMQRVGFQAVALYFFFISIIFTLFYISGCPDGRFSKEEACN
jgi:hypothetical protein